MLHARVCLLLLLGWPLVLAGCGGSLYEQRLKNTEKLFRRMELLDSHLHPAWTDRVISLRAPRQFRELPAPRKSEEEDALSVLDERQPDFMNVEFPGMRAAFRAPLAVFAEGSDRPETYPGYLYILSNHDLPLPPVAGGEPVASSGPTAATFHVDFVRLLADALRVTPPEQWSDAPIPVRKEDFVAQVRYKRVEFHPVEPVHGAQAEFTAYLFQQGDIQVVILWVVPHGVAAGEKLRERIDFALETLVVTGDQVGGDRASGGKAGPAGEDGF